MATSTNGPQAKDKGRSARAQLAKAALAGQRETIAEVGWSL